MVTIIYKVDPVKRTIKPMSGHAVAEQDHRADTIRFAFPDSIDPTAEGTTVRVMYIRPDGGDPVAKTLTFYKHSRGYYLYDWTLQKSDLQECGSLVFSLCMLTVSEGVVSEEWHTAPYSLDVLRAIHTDNSDEGDESITPTVAERVAVLESMIQRVASGAPIVVSSTSEMTDTEQIYVLSTDGYWYYYDGSAWVAGGEYGGVATGSITTNKLADGAVTTAKIADGAVTSAKLANDVHHKLLRDSEAIGTTDYIFNPGIVDGQLQNDGTIDTTKNIWCTTDYIPISSGNQYVLSKIDFNSNYSALRCVYDKNKNFLEFVSITVSSSEYYWNPSDNVAFARFSVSKNTYKSGIAFTKSISDVEKNKSYLDRIASIVENAERDNGIDYVSLLGTSIGMLKSDGTKKDNASFKTTDFIPVKSGMNYKAYVPDTTDFTSYTLFVCTYDSDKNLLSYLVPTAQNRTYYITPSDNTAYIRLSVSLNVSNSGFAFSTVQKRNDIIANKIKNIGNALGDFDLISDYGGKEGKIDQNGNVNNDQSFFTTSFIPVVPGLTYALKRINQKTDAYTIHRCTYDSNGDLLEYVWFNWESTTRLYTVPYNVKFVRFSYPRALYDDGFTFGFTKNYIEKSLTERMLSIYNYNGDVVDISVHKKYTCEPMFADADRVLPTGKTAQAFAISNNIIFQFLADDMCRLYDYSTQAILGDLSIKCGHANSANFSHAFQEETDEFPLIYLSDTDGNVYVNQITRVTSTLIRTLYFDPAVFGNIPQLALDSDSDTCYIIGQRPTAVVADNPEYIITVCDLSDLIQSDDKYTPRVISSFTVTIPGEKIVLQGVNYLNGCIWIASGGTSTAVLSRITVINIQRETVISTFTDFPEIASLHEMEDLKFVKNPNASNYDIILHIREYGYYRMIF